MTDSVAGRPGVGPAAHSAADTAGGQGYAGPVLRSGEVADAVVEAVREDNAEREIIIEEHASYIRVKVAGECIVRRETVERMLGRPFEMREIEINMPAFSGHIRTSSDAFRFVIGQRA